MAARKRSKKNLVFVWLIIGPILTWYGVFLFYPAINAFRMSLYAWNPLIPDKSVFIGMQNYLGLLEDKRFMISFFNTLRYAALRVLILVPVSLMVAVLLEKIGKIRKLHLVCVFLPVIMSIAVTGVLFRIIYQPIFGIFNHLLGILHLPARPFLRSSGEALYWLLATDIWKSIGFGTVIFLAGIMNIPGVFYECAKIDGATAWSSFWHITVPLLKNSFVFMYVITAIVAFQTFEIVFVMTHGGPGRSTYTLPYLIYMEGMKNVRMGYATSVAIILFAIIMFLTITQLKLLRYRERM